MSHRPALVAIDLGAESCRVSLLEWQRDAATFHMVHRFANAPMEQDGHLYWNLESICAELHRGLRQCAKLAPEGIASIGVTGWAVDYVCIDRQGRPFAQPFCYRDARGQRAMAEVHQRISAERLYHITGVQIQPINTIYQLYADRLAGYSPGRPWLNLPEYILHWLGAPPIAEYTNATHTALLDSTTGNWSTEIFECLGLDPSTAPEIVAPGTMLGRLNHPLRGLHAFKETQLIAPACHDTASAIAGIAVAGDGWGYISSGTWSLVGTLLPAPKKTEEAARQGFTNLGAATREILFHRGIAGMWLLRQCMNEWSQTSPCKIEELVDAAEKLPAAPHLLDLDDAAFLAPGDMPQRINAQLASRGIEPLPTHRDAAPHYANLIFHSLAARYALLFEGLAKLTGKSISQICVVGGGRRNPYLNRLTAQATGLPVHGCSAESSTIGNFALQWARLEHPDSPLDAPLLAPYAAKLNAIHHT